jgi:hypothetical protein
MPSFSFIASYEAEDAAPTELRFVLVFFLQIFRAYGAGRSVLAARRVKADHPVILTKLGALVDFLREKMREHFSSMP